MKIALAAEKTIEAEGILDAPPAAKYSVADWLALALATGGGTGFFPVVPATFGSVVGAGVYLISLKILDNLTMLTALQKFAAPSAIASLRVSAAAFFLLALFFAGVWSATRAEKLLGAKDPKPVVIDEIFGQVVTFLFLPADFAWWTIPAGFFAFRLFDIWKLYPADRLESLPKGLGVMSDDAAAGCYAAALLVLLNSAYLLFIG